MQTYWDLSEKERAQLSSAEVEKFADAELMLKGVLKVRPLRLVDVPAMPQPDLELFVVSRGGWQTGNVGHKSEDVPRESLDRGLFIDSEYVNGQSISVARELDREGDTVKMVRCYSEKQLKTARAAIEKASAAKSANERAEREHDEALKKQRDALDGMWSDWLLCVQKHQALAQVINTFRDYEQTAGSSELAAKFLVKVFSAATIAEAAEWFGIDIPLPAEQTIVPMLEQSHEPTIEEGVAF